MQTRKGALLCPFFVYWPFYYLCSQPISIMTDMTSNNITLTGNSSEMAIQLVDYIATDKKKLSWKQLIEIVPLNSSFLLSFVDSAKSQIESDQIKGRFRNTKVYEYFGELKEIASNESYSKEQEAEIYDLIDKISDVIVSKRTLKEGGREKNDESDYEYLKQYGLSKKDPDRIRKKMERENRIMNNVSYAILIVLAIIVIFWPECIAYAFVFLLSFSLIKPLL